MLKIDTRDETLLQNLRSHIIFNDPDKPSSKPYNMLSKLTVSDNHFNKYRLTIIFHLTHQLTKFGEYLEFMYRPILTTWCTLIKIFT